MFYNSHLFSWILIALFIQVGAARATDPFDTRIVSTFEINRAEAFRLYFEGKARTAAIKIAETLPFARTAGEAAFLKRDLMEICARSYEWDCVSRTSKELMHDIENNTELKKMLLPYIVVRDLSGSNWHRLYNYAEGIIKLPRGPFSIIEAYSNPALTAEFQRELHSYYIHKGDLRAAGGNLSANIHSLLLTKSEPMYTRCKITIDIIASLFDSQDIISAFSWLDRTSHIIETCIPPKSILYAEYKMLTGQLLGFTNAHQLTVSTLKEAISLYENLEIEQGAKNYRIGSANSIACAALVLDNRVADARDLHSKHPLNGHKEEIFAKDELDDLAEFYFAIADIFVASSGGDKPDPRWERLLRNKLSWDLGDLENNNVESYRLFAMALIRLGGNNRSEGSQLLNEVALARLSNFQIVLKGSLESYQLPSLIDKILIGSSLTNAINYPSAATPEILLRGSEVIGRNLRHALADVAFILSRQPNAEARKDAQTYVHLLGSKREWELTRVTQLLSNDVKLPEGGTLTGEYEAAVGTIEKLRDKIEININASGLPTLGDLQSALMDDEAFVTHFPVVGGLAKFCVTRDAAAYAVFPADPNALKDFKAVEKALSKPPASYADARRFPVASAFKLYEILFSGLDACLQPGMHIISATPPDLASIPFGALLRANVADGDSFDARTAPWLIRYFSFSTVISARHLLATRIDNASLGAFRSYLGVGDPEIAPNAVAVEAATERRLPPMEELPETTEEISAVARVFGRDAETLTRENASEELFRAKSLSDYDVIHFATHGIGPTELPSIGEAGIILSHGKNAGDLDDGILTASEISRLSLGSRLVVLSACRTAEFNLTQASRNAQDLQAAFNVAGSPTLLATLWQVDSYAARDITVTFFRRWKLETANAARALQQSMLQYLARSDELRQHPWYWAPFVLVGNGDIRARNFNRTPSPNSAAAHLLAGFASGGEILDAGQIGGEFVVSMYGEWDGAKMNGMISRRDLEGEEKWRVASRDIGAGKLIADRDGIYTTGYTTSQPWTPILRSISPDGDVRWEKQLTEIGGHTLSDPVISHDGVYVVSFPHLEPSAIKDKSIVFLFDRNGHEIKRAHIDISRSGVSIGAPIFIEKIDKSLFIAVNIGASMKLSRDLNRWGLPKPCYVDAKSNIYRLDADDREVKFVASIPNFKVTSIGNNDGSLILGGEALDFCTLRGQAQIFRLLDNRLINVWKTKSIFSTSIAGFINVRDQLVVAATEERSIGIDTRKYDPNAEMDVKRWGDDPYSSRTAQLIYLTRGDRFVRDELISCGLSIFITKLSLVNQQIFAFGTVGGMPAYWRFNDH